MPGKIEFRTENREGINYRYRLSMGIHCVAGH